MSMLTDQVDLVIGIDTHKHTHHAAFVDRLGSVHGMLEIEANAAGYRLRIAHNPYFSSLLLDRKVDTPSVVVTGLPIGAYYWSIESYDANGKESVESEKNRFTVIAKSKEKIDIALDIDPFVQHGHVIEVTGKTEGGARVMVNGMEVPFVGDDGTFHYFTPPMTKGSQTIVITGQNRRGGTAIKRVSIVIP